MSTATKCKGCGAVLQRQKPDMPGYALSFEHLYCQACYRLLHYGEANSHFHPEDLPSLAKDALIVMISSVLHLDLLFSHPVYRYQPKATYVYVINQIDLLPASTNLDLLLKNITRKAKNNHVPYQDIILMSANNRHDIDAFKDYLKHFKQQDIYLLGVQNSGKTTLFKALSNQAEALAFKKAGLTQQALTALFGSKTLHDMPGLYQEGYLHTMLPYAIYKDLIPDREIKPKVYQLHPGHAIFLEGLIAMANTGKDVVSIVLYISRLVDIHRTNQARIVPLLDDRRRQFPIHVNQYAERPFKLSAGKQQITLADMGMVHVTGPAHVTITYPKGMHLSLTEALFQ